MKQQHLFEPDPPEWELVDRDDIWCAQLVFNRPLDTPFDYIVPEEFRPRLKPGMRVRVPFGRGDHLITGYCVGLGKPTSPHTARLKRVAALIDQHPLLTPAMLDLTRWIADRYLCGWGQVLEAVVPAGVKNRAGTRNQVVVRINPEAWPANPPPELTDKQTAVLQALSAAGRPLDLGQLARLARCGTAPITALRRRGILLAETERTEVDQSGDAPVERQADLDLNVEQQRVLHEIVQALRARICVPFLVHGVTGSGKTEVYIRAIREVVSYGRQAIVLVPEISLTPQTIRRFRSRFDSVAVLHSHQTDAERHRHWLQIAAGRVQVVVGARSAIFAPTPHLGLIVIDEEHEHSFKQDTVPRYHAREVALERARRESVPLLLGSATPTLEAWQRAQTGEFRLLTLQRRVAGLPMPPVLVVDTREDPVIRGGASIGRALKNAMQQALADQGQIILFLNLRGFSPVLWCPACGQSIKCPNCDVSVTWHREQNVARCHSCDFESPPPRSCPACQREGVRYLGTGTQRLEAEVKAKFPGVACVRMDSDSMRRPGSHDTALEAFRKGETRILLGTQMISKGLDFPNVTLVGVIDADTLLHQPDLRAGERTFQLIAQVAGRTGRSARGGRVLVQTSSPAEPPIVFASRHDYLGFVRRELAQRQQMLYPPFETLVRVIVRGPDDAVTAAAIHELATLLRTQIESQKLGARLLGPAPAPVARLNTLFRYHLQLASADLELLKQLWRTHGATFKLPPHVEIAVDVDPINLR
ncbi:MAG: primosomal protein N' [Planctomycetaceae bacterium]